MLCKRCGTEFEPRTALQKHCSLNCYASEARKRPRAYLAIRKARARKLEMRSRRLALPALTS